VSVCLQQVAVGFKVGVHIAVGVGSGICLQHVSRLGDHLGQKAQE
jgi:hypothetical protein